MTNRIAVLSLAAVLACGCATPPDTGPEAAAAGTAQEEAAVAAALRNAAASRLDYKISPADLVSVTVYEVPEMSRKAKVNAGGVIFLPFAGGVKIGGNTVGAAQALIARKLSAYVVRPQVSVFIEEYAHKYFFVMGEVQKPGSYPIPAESRMTILEAISTAGGFTPVAAQDRARVLRTVNGESMHYTVDVRTITSEGQKDKDMILEPNDVVFVPQSFF